jgi:alpha-beta hydrolase superfamily lysophospholipase
MDAASIAKSLASFAAVYAAICGVACAAHRSLLYPAPPREEPPRGDGIEWVRGRDATGETFALCAFADGPDAQTIVHFHGNGEQVAWQARFARDARSAGVGYCAVEYPGYGVLDQRATTERAMYDAAESVLRQLAARGIAGDRLALSGQSLGTGVAAEMARRGHGSRLILLSPYTSIVEVAQRIVRVLPASWIVRDRFDTRSKAASITMPVLIVHGTLDTLIPVEMGRQLARTFPNARMVELAQRGHNDLFAESEQPVWPLMLDFARGRATAR